MNANSSLPGSGAESWPSGSAATYLARGAQLEAIRGWASLARRLPRGRETFFRAGWRLLGRPRRFLGKIDGSPAVIDAWDGGTSLRQYLWQWYEPATTVVFLASLHDSACVVDVGANKGFFSLLAARRVGAAGRVVSYEPSPGNVVDLAATRDLNARANWLVQPWAVSSQEGEVRFSTAGMEHGHSGWGRIHGSGDITIRTVALDDQMERLSITRIDLLKMDIEGHELEALRGMRRLLESRSIRRLMVELHPQRLDTGAYRDWLNSMREWGYAGSVLDERSIPSSECIRAIRSGTWCGLAPRLLAPLRSVELPGDRLYQVWDAEPIEQGE